MMRDIKFQIRHAWYQSRARALIKWLLVRLGLWVDKSIKEISKGANIFWHFLPLVVAGFLCYWSMAFLGVFNHG